MSYSGKNSFIKPDMSSKIWRYMDFFKFVDLISSKKLFLCKPSDLGDPFEGAVPAAIRNALGRAGMGSLANHIYSAVGENIYINCWHKSEYESDAMWKIYALNKAGIAIQTTVNKLVEAIEHYPFEIHLGMIEYIDHETYLGAGFSPYHLYMYKDRSFEHEKELRIIFPLKDKMNVEKCGNGIKIPVDVSKLIENVYISPTSDDWIIGIVKSVMSIYGIDKPHIRSKFYR